MSRRRKKRSGGLKSINQIDVTPLTDLTFILLVVFMLTAPVLERSIKIEPPEMNAGDIQADKSNRIINITEAGDIVYEKQNYMAENLSATLLAELEANPKLRFFIRADKTRPYGDVVDLLALLHRAGIEQASLITEAEK